MRNHRDPIPAEDSEARLARVLARSEFVPSINRTHYLKMILKTIERKEPLPRPKAKKRL
jgi:hypothetical protein